MLGVIKSRKFPKKDIIIKTIPTTPTIMSSIKLSFITTITPAYVIGCLVRHSSQTIEFRTANSYVRQICNTNLLNLYCKNVAIGKIICKNMSYCKKYICITKINLREKHDEIGQEESPRSNIATDD